MKSNQFKYIATVLVAVLLCVISTQNIYALYKNSDPLTKQFSANKCFEYNQTPLSQHNFTDENIFENETEDESESGFNGALPLLNSTAGFITAVFAAKSITHLPSGNISDEIESPLYLAIHSLRI